MNKIICFLLLVILSSVVHADNALSFAPPTSDFSVVFLGNLFGIVDGVLSGSGSQIMGSMFAVFNAAVLALGGIIIMYTLMVSTMNTAHEGQMLGQKWSSIWIPVRSTIGLALLIPKASGYCLMQIFIMWVVLQGVGAADKVWNAALNYLNKGGVIIQAQQAVSSAALKADNNNTGVGSIASGAFTILAGQVCMLGIQTQLENLRQAYLSQKSKGSGPCVNPSADMKIICDSAIPDFLGSVNAVSAQSSSANKINTIYSVQMPNFNGSPFSFLNGICGQLSWKSIDSITTIQTQTINSNSSTGALGVLKDLAGVNSSGYSIGTQDNTVSSSAFNIANGYTNGTTNSLNLNASDLSAIQSSRAIAVQQMYVDLTSTAQLIVGNAPGITTNSSNPASPYITDIANLQFGVPYGQNNQPCTSTQCYLWGPSTDKLNGATLLTGNEILNAISDYNAVMMPTLNLMVQMNDMANAQNSRAFIANASQQGWIMAGAYFFNLVKIQASATLNSNMVDTDNGLSSSSIDPSKIVASFGLNNSCTGDYDKLCTWFQKDKTKLQLVETLIDAGPPINTNPMTKPSMVISSTSTQSVLTGKSSSTVYGYAGNSIFMSIPGQPGIAPLTFASAINFSIDTTIPLLKQQEFDCGGIKIVFFYICFGQMMGNLFYNVIFLFIYNTFMKLFGSIIKQVMMGFLMVPLQAMSDIFKEGVAVLTMPGVNPIIALANMGVQYINFSGSLWLMLIGMSVSTSLIPVFGVFIFALMTMALPLVIAWVGVMVSIGMTTAYYIPILPYLIFTFGGLAWMISVIEAMVAAPIVALGVTHPEGHDAFGKGEPAIMILINVFLRPSMMIIGYISAIALSYVGVWFLNAGYDTAISFVQMQKTPQAPWYQSGTLTDPTGSGMGGYSNWAGIFAFFFSILTYTSLYLTLVQKSFTLISYLPDKVLRWIGGSPESLGQESAAWAGDVEKAQQPAVEATTKAAGQIDKQSGAQVAKGMSKMTGGLGKAGGGGSAEATGSKSGGGEGGDSKPDMSKSASMMKE